MWICDQLLAELHIPIIVILDGNWLILTKVNFFCPWETQKYIKDENKKYVKDEESLE